jgi:hypothetical protein
MSPKRIIKEAVQETGWDESSQLLVCLDFIEQMNKIEPNFDRYVQARVDEEMYSPSFDEIEDDFPSYPNEDNPNDEWVDGTD